MKKRLDSSLRGNDGKHGGRTVREPHGPEENRRGGPPYEDLVSSLLCGAEIRNRIPVPVFTGPGFIQTE
jgi:hypothetical protein